MKEGWEYKTLGEVCKIYNGNSINADYKKKHFLGATGGLPFIATKDVSPLGTIDYNNGVRIPNYEEYKVAPANSVFICAEGGSAGKKFAYVEKDVCFGNKLFCITPKDKAIKGKFIYHFVQSDNFRGQFFSLLTGLIGGVSANKFQKIEIPVPSLSEQQSIVDYLDSAFAKIDAMKANAEKALNEAKALFQASLKEMLEPKEGWEEKNLQEVACDFSRGKSKHRPRNDKKLFGGNYPFIQTGEIRNANVYVTSHSSTYNEIGLSQSKLWPKDTVCITIAANIAEVAILKYPSCFPDSVIGFVADINKVDKMFVFYSLIHYQQELKKQGKGSAQDNINLGTFEKNRFPFPSLQEQQSIVETLDSLKSKVDRLQENYDKISRECDALKQALLRAVFEG